MIGVFAEDRVCYTIGIYYKSVRRCLAKIQAETLRFAYTQSLQGAHTKRYAYADRGHRTTDRTIVTAAVWAEGSYRLCVIAPAAFNSSLRTCTYVPGYQILSFTTEVILSMEYHSNRTAIAYKSPCTQRTCWAYLPQITEITAVVNVARDVYVNTPSTTVAIRYTTDRKVYWHKGTFTIRFTTYTVTDHSERKVLAQNYSKSVVYTPKTVVAVSRHTERKCSAKMLPTTAERVAYAKVAEVTERYCTFLYRDHSIRFILCHTYQIYELLSISTAIARLEWSSRVCFTSMFDYHSERFGFAEKRPLKKVSYPTQSPDVLLPFYIQDKSAQMKFKVQRNSEILTEGGEPLSVESSVFHQAFTIKGEESKKEIVVSGVDNTGAAISLYKDVKKELLYSTSLQIIIHDHIERYTERTCYLTYVIPTLVIFSKVVK